MHITCSLSPLLLFCIHFKKRSSTFWWHCWAKMAKTVISCPLPPNACAWWSPPKLYSLCFKINAITCTHFFPLRILDSSKVKICNFHWSNLCTWWHSHFINYFFYHLPIRERAWIKLGMLIRLRRIYNLWRFMPCLQQFHMILGWFD